MNELNLLKAINYAAKAHRGQLRRSDSIPVISHPYGVGMLLLKNKCSETVVIAGLLHDVIEDCPNYKIIDIIKEFGSEVGNIVADLTQNDESLWHKKKQEHIEILRDASLDTKMVCAADNIHNIDSLLDSLEKNGDKAWDIYKVSKEDKVKYFGEMYISITKGYIYEDISIFGAYRKTMENLYEYLGKQKRLW